ncbi:uroporphyrinogen-III C-methyltransferase [Sansalvadorimonas verongulae]|uniref:uroporphyrinogen-III C-methyltransferase n=1 Tax=Sansalvadorimonas verongulae TaxID=2172824 RepID=UPI0012BCABC5|nr:uroporphyrinogen-III C-methyltransferase [Sansalvadorimonas verongulae]MTI15305.1 hypothetical protein [Sansalvadorimonas verongulae]
MNDNTPQKMSQPPKDERADKSSSGMANRQSVKTPTISRLAVFATALSLTLTAVIGAAGWYGYQSVWPLLSNDKLAGQSWVDQQFTENNQSVKSALYQTQQTIKQNMQDVVGQSDRLVTRIDNVDRRLNRLQGADRNVWKLAEAEYLMRLANQRLLTMHDIKSAKTLLSQADVLLVAVDEYGLFNVRQALAEDLAALRATPENDITASWMELNALADRIDQLPLASSNAPMVEPASEPEIITSDQPETLPDDAPLQEQVSFTLSQWISAASEAAEDIFNTFAAQFRLRESNHKVAPLVSARQEMYLRQNLRLMLEQAQTSLLQGRTEVYQASLRKAQGWLNQWFINNGSEITALHTALDRLAGTPVEQSTPDISRSLTSLKAYINEKADHNLPVEPVTKSKTEDRS